MSILRQPTVPPMPGKSETKELREFAKEITREMEKRRYSYRDADMLVAVLKDEINQCREAETLKPFTALEEK